jgi:hypothetical protein
MLDADICQKKLQGFVDQVCPGQSPLYEQVCRQILSDQLMFELMQHTPALQPGPNLLLAAIHFLLLRGARHELREFYGSCTDQPRPATEAWPAFRDFCLTQRDEILCLLSRQRVQTNEVGRCGYLFPALSIAHASQPERSLAVIEIGASAGLNLHWDQYAYDYGPIGRYGDPSSPVVIRSQWRGAGPSLPSVFPSVAHRVGIDLHPVDVNDPNQALWLQALVWPDQAERIKLLQAAIQVFRQSPVPLVAGNALEVLPAEIANAPVDARLCLVHCHTLNQFSDLERAKFEQLIREASDTRDITVISAEWIRTPQPELRLERWRNGSVDNSLLAQVHHHGQWIEWSR